jgi:hypothetical protein
MGGEGGERSSIRGRRNWEERRKGGGLEIIQRSEEWKWKRRKREMSKIGQERIEGSGGMQEQGRQYGGQKGKWRESREQVTKRGGKK